MRTLPGLAGVLAGVLAGAAVTTAIAIALDDDAGSQGSGSETAGFNYRARAEDDPALTTVLDLGGLRLSPQCNDVGGYGKVDVGLESEVDDALVTVSIQFPRQLDRDGVTTGFSAGYAYTKRNIDSGTGGLGFLGLLSGSVGGANGTLTYARPDGGVVTVVFGVDDDISHSGAFSRSGVRAANTDPVGDCAFVGTATYVKGPE